MASFIGGAVIGAASAAIASIVFTPNTLNRNPVRVVTAGTTAGVCAVGMNLFFGQVAFYTTITILSLGLLNKWIGQEMNFKKVDSNYEQSFSSLNVSEINSVTTEEEQLPCPKHGTFCMYGQNWPVFCLRG